MHAEDWNSQIVIQLVAEGDDKFVVDSLVDKDGGHMETGVVYRQGQVVISRVWLASVEEDSLTRRRLKQEETRLVTHAPRQIPCRGPCRGLLDIQEPLLAYLLTSIVADFAPRDVSVWTVRSTSVGW